MKWIGCIKADFCDSIKRKRKAGKKEEREKNHYFHIFWSLY